MSFKSLELFGEKSQRDADKLIELKGNLMESLVNPRVLEARAYRDGEWWTIEIPELCGPSPDSQEEWLIAVGQARHKHEVQAAANDLASTWLDVDESFVQVNVTFSLLEKDLTLTTE